MEDNPLWSRRGFLGMGVGVLGAAGLAACGDSSDVDPPGAAGGSAGAARRRGVVEGLLDGGAVAEAVLGRRRTRRSTASIKKFADATGTKIENSLVQADAGDVVAKIDAEVKGGVARDLAFMTDSRFVAQFQALGDLEDVTDIVKALTAKYGEPTRGVQELLRLRRQVVRHPLPLHRDRVVPAQGLDAGQGHLPQGRLHLGGAAGPVPGDLRSGQAPVRLGHDREPVR